MRPFFWWLSLNNNFLESSSKGFQPSTWSSGKYFDWLLTSSQFSKRLKTPKAPIRPRSFASISWRRGTLGGILPFSTKRNKLPKPYRGKKEQLTILLFSFEKLREALYSTLTLFTQNLTIFYIFPQSFRMKVIFTMYTEFFILNKESNGEGHRKASYCDLIFKLNEDKIYEVVFWLYFKVIINHEIRFKVLHIDWKL